MAQATKQAASSELERKNERRSENAVSPWDPFGMLNSFKNEMNRLFEDFSFGTYAPLEGKQFDWMPQTEAFKHSDQFVVRADLPGLSKDNIDVQIENDRIIIRGERKSEHDERERGSYHTERSYGSFYRSIALPDGADSEQAKARFKDGVLEISMPLEERPAGGRSLQIE